LAEKPRQRSLRGQCPSERHDQAASVRLQNIFPAVVSGREAEEPNTLLGICLSDGSRTTAVGEVESHEAQVRERAVGPSLAERSDQVGPLDLNAHDTIEYRANGRAARITSGKRPLDEGLSNQSAQNLACPSLADAHLTSDGLKRTSSIGT
jgi:hypothetical protein